MSDDASEYSGAVHRRDAARLIRFLLVALIVVAIVLVAMDNRDDVRLGYVFGDAQAPIWIVIVAAAIAGAIIGWLIKHRPRRNI
jgi:uncharacterized integral membrane protein